MPDTREPCPIRVIVRECSDPKIVWHDKHGDHNDRFFREWMASTAWWALRNDKTMETRPDPLED